MPRRESTMPSFFSFFYNRKLKVEFWFGFEYLFSKFTMTSLKFLYLASSRKMSPTSALHFCLAPKMTLAVFESFYWFQHQSQCSQTKGTCAMCRGFHLWRGHLHERCQSNLTKPLPSHIRLSSAIGIFSASLLDIDPTWNLQQKHSSKFGGIENFKNCRCIPSSLCYFAPAFAVQVASGASSSTLQLC